MTTDLAQNRFPFTPDGVRILYQNKIVSPTLCEMVMNPCCTLKLILIGVIHKWRKLNFWNLTSPPLYVSSSRNLSFFGQVDGPLQQCSKETSHFSLPLPHPYPHDRPWPMDTLVGVLMLLVYLSAFIYYQNNFQYVGHSSFNFGIWHAKHDSCFDTMRLVPLEPDINIAINHCYGDGCESRTGHLRQCWYQALEAPASLLVIWSQDAKSNLLSKACTSLQIIYLKIVTSARVRVRT